MAATVTACRPGVELHKVVILSPCMSAKAGDDGDGVDDTRATDRSSLCPPYCNLMGSSLTAAETFSGVNFNTSGTGGGRVGYWFDRLPWDGMGVDVFYFSPNIDAQTVPTAVTLSTPLGSISGSVSSNLANASIGVVGVSFDVLRLRLPLLTSEAYPQGQLQPYFTAGPALFRTHLKDSTNFSPPSNQSDTDVSVGVKVGTGLSFQVTRWLVVFGEYRYLHFSAQTGFQSTSPVSQATVSTDFNTHQVIGGVSFRF